MIKTNCHFDSSIKKEGGSYMQKIINMAAIYTTVSGDIDPYTFFQEKTAHELWDDDNKKLLYLYFLFCIGKNFEEIEELYLNTVFELEDEEKMTDHLCDFIINGQI